MSRLVVDPVTRVDGALRVEVELNGANGIEDAWLAGTVYRGLEHTLVGRDARDAWLMAQRICGACGPAHAVASVTAIEDALGIVPPPNAVLLRNLLAGSRLVIDHVAHFYLRQAVDWVDVMQARRADPAAAAAIARGQSNAKVNESLGDFQLAKARLDDQFGGAATGPFALGPWSHPAYRLDADHSLVVMKHALDAIAWQRKMTRLQAILGGKSPHPQTLLVGGMTLAPVWGGPKAPNQGEHPWIFEQEAPLALSSDGINLINGLLVEAKLFVQGAFVPDVLSIALADHEWAKEGRGIGHYLAFGAFPRDERATAEWLFPRGRVMGRDWTDLVEVGDIGVAEATLHSHYAGDGALRRPTGPALEPQYGGPALPYASLAGADRYSWVAAPRYEDDPMEVGPAARLLVGLAARNGAVVDALGRYAASLSIDTDGLGSTLGRLVARAIEADLMVGQLADWLAALTTNLGTGDIAVADVTKWDRGHWPAKAEGVALTESPRGAVGHWVAIENGRIARYQIVDASTFNASPRDHRGRRGAIEQALVGLRLADPARPLELLRTVHSFDPCLACAVH